MLFVVQFKKAHLVNKNVSHTRHWGKQIIYKPIREVKDMSIREQHEERIERRENRDPSLVGATFIKYAAYIIITLAVLYFIVKYLLPMFN